MISSGKYWENRYKSGGNSGAGSYGTLANYKATIINTWITTTKIESIAEFGCGDGNQLSLFIPVSYTGYDISETIIALCKEKFAFDNNKKFYRYNEYDSWRDGGQFNLVLSLDVIYHLVEDVVFEEYMCKLFEASNRYVIIYSSNGDLNIPLAEHLRDRKFTDWIDSNIKNFKLIGKIENPYKYKEGKDATNTSISDFYMYERIKE